MPRAVKLYYLYRFFHHLNFFWAIDKLFFTANQINPFQLSFILAVWSLYVLIFEVPSGALADRWSRKWILVIAQVFYTLSYAIWIFFTGFWWFIVGYMLRGTGGFLESGTKEALFYDHLKAKGVEKDYEKYLGKLWLVTTIAFLIAGTCAGFLADRWSFSLVLTLTTISNLVALGLTLVISDAPKQRSTEELSYWQFLRQAWQKAFKHPLLLRAMFYTMTVLAINGVLDEYDQLYLKSIGVPLAAMGVWWLLRMGSEALGGLMAHRLKVFGRDKILELIVVITAALLTITSFINSLTMMLVLAACFFCFSVATVLNEARMQEFIESHERATINSINSLLKEIMAIMIGLSFGYIANQFDSQRAMLVYVCVLVGYFAITHIKLPTKAIVE